MEKFSFKKGYSQVRQIDAPVVKERIMNSLGLTTRAAWRQRLLGIVEPKVSEAEAIEKIFKEFGITEIWGAESYEHESQTY